ncbi:hypothetical protein AVEN_141442-1 [Araneus ventricosus]|uniref:ZC3H15/TMA46 family C-terminal domain-containing protein n=1 Tax=Araneus ventricosus TaxID=182803 RepID=A0A4Y2TTW2_ARAVE|nr:hypothetical protein AVEN_141442-1 [Araneus ventricosus]
MSVVFVSACRPFCTALMGLSSEAFKEDKFLFLVLKELDYFLSVLFRGGFDVYYIHREACSLCLKSSLLFPSAVFCRFEGVRVTVESFMTWKVKFDQEMAELKKIQAKEEVASKKLTGRELFEKDKTLVDSDLKFLQDEGEVKVDESLFQELDDLELQEDEEDLSS